jgi:Flp pilus assembly protein TadD
LSIFIRLCAAAALALCPVVAMADSMSLTPPQLFTLADQARDRGDFALAESAYRALAENPDIDLRNEARFRLALMLADREHKLKDAAIVLRRILDERPNAQRVRLELARVQAMMGNLGAARREMRAAQAGGLRPTWSAWCVSMPPRSRHANRSAARSTWPWRPTATSTARRDPTPWAR